MRGPWKLRLALAAAAISAVGVANLPSANAMGGDDRYWVCVAVDEPVDKSVCQGNPVPRGARLPGPPELPSAHTVVGY